MAILEREENGRVKKGALTSDEASAMGKISAQKRNQDLSDQVDDILEELNIEGTTARILAEQFARGGPGAIAAGKELFRLAGFGKQEAAKETKGHYIVPPPGERCPRCGMPASAIVLSDEVAQRLLRIINERKNGNIPGAIPDANAQE